MDRSPSPFGRHLLIEMMGGSGFDDVARVERALRDAAVAAGARVLSVHSHRFSPQGVTGVALLAESHITVHTWPERGYAAFDLFLCGGTDPMKAVPVLARAFETDNIKTRLVDRGPVTTDA